MNSFNEMSIKVSREIDTQSIRARSRTKKELIRYQYAVRHLLTDLWKAHLKHPDVECSINKRSGYYSEDEWEELVNFRDYQGSKKDLYSWSAYIVPKDAKIGDSFYIPDIIGDIVAEEFWGSSYRTKDGVGIWNGNDLEIDESLYKETFMVG